VYGMTTLERIKDMIIIMNSMTADTDFNVSIRSNALIASTALELIELELKGVKESVSKQEEDIPITAVYLYEGNEFFRENYPFKRLYADGQSFVINSTAVTVLDSYLNDHTYYINCSKQFK
jgi:phage major head subunit gpT-like protein